jgi:hypothetical protein
MMPDAAIMKMSEPLIVGQEMRTDLSFWTGDTTLATSEGKGRRANSTY